MKLKELVPDTELKLMLDSKQVLDEKDELKDDFKKQFQMNDYPETMFIWYIDTYDRALHREDWSVSFRQRSDNSSLELTIKKLFNEKDYKSMIDSKQAQLFAMDFKPEIDMTFGNKKYNLSFERKFSDEIKLDASEAKRLTIINSPSVFIDWPSKNAGFDMLCESKLMGPVEATLFKGVFEGYEAKLEIWPLNQTVCEISFDVPTKKSEELKQSLLKALGDDNIILQSDILKADLFLDEFSKKRSTKSAN